MRFIQNSTFIIQNCGLPCYGIRITIYWERNTQHRSPHFHVIYNEFDCKYEIPTLNVLEGVLPNKAHRMVIDWAQKHIKELEANWKLAIL